MSTSAGLVVANLYYNQPLLHKMSVELQVSEACLSGLVGEQYGWRVMYYAATILIVLLFTLLHYKLPKTTPVYKGNYGSLLKSIGFYFRTEPTVRLAALHGALTFLL
ncbi:hypothetical protein LY01_02680 [Nonlabens xylanidelens]|uniref:MFS transporter n=2 Tax=Nonlabens xylanidelens TaxID=191564 RepID=A0A2S6IFL3_9FLAO|nr:hypothetical protein LY01_02680 [Nonlabens xylanidelens]PQJ18812.1 hypothetical protein BST94_07295 [Nonlabens xylanidelens]